MALDTEKFPAGLGAQFRRNLWLYASGAVLLGAQQVLMASRDFQVRDAVDATVKGRSSDAVHAAIIMLVVSVAAAGMRVLSRITIFTGGRNAEYELRAVLPACTSSGRPSSARCRPARS
jgi:ATP-binding cassette subfamily B protein